MAKASPNPVAKPRAAVARSKGVGIYMNDEVHAKLEKMAAEAGVSSSAVVSRLILAAGSDGNDRDAKLSQLVAEMAILLA